PNEHPYTGTLAPVTGVQTHRRDQGRGRRDIPTAARPTGTTRPVRGTTARTVGPTTPTTRTPRLRTDAPAGLPRRTPVRTTRLRHPATQEEDRPHRRHLHRRRRRHRRRRHPHPAPHRRRQ